MHARTETQVLARCASTQTQIAHLGPVGSVVTRPAFGPDGAAHTQVAHLGLAGSVASSRACVFLYNCAPIFASFRQKGVVGYVVGSRRRGDVYHRRQCIRSDSSQVVSRFNVVCCVCPSRFDRFIVEIIGPVGRGRNDPGPPVGFLHPQRAVYEPSASHDPTLSEVLGCVRCRNVLHNRNALDLHKCPLDPSSTAVWN